MPDFGSHTGYIYAAYGFAAVILGALIAFAFAGRAAARRRLAALEKTETLR